MPIVSEKSERSRRGSRRWLLVSGGLLLGLMFLLPLVPLAMPVALRAGDRSLHVSTFWGDAVPGGLMAGGTDVSPGGAVKPAFSWSLTRAPAYLAISRIAPLRPGDYHERWITCGHLSYYLEWYRSDPGGR